MILVLLMLMESRRLCYCSHASRRRTSVSFSTPNLLAGFWGHSFSGIFVGP